MKTKKRTTIDPDNPSLTDQQLGQFRPVSPERRAIFRKTVENFRKRGRPAKGADKYCPVTIRLHPAALAWAKAEAKRRGIGYQTVINELLLCHAA